MEVLTKENRIRGAVEYLLIIALYYITGGAFSYDGYSTQITLMFLASGLICLLTGSWRRLLTKSALVVLTTQCLFLLLVPTLNNDDVSSYIAIMMQLCIGAFCASSIPRNMFMEKYVHVMTVFAAVSLVFFAAGIVAPNVVKLFPLVKSNSNFDYHNAYIHVYMQGSEGLFFRNPGICWEPGCYQMFLNVALVGLCSMKGQREVPRFGLKLGILVLTVATTMSTTGLVLLALILVYFRKKLFVGMHGGRLLLGAVAVAVVGAALLSQINFVDFVSDKFGREFLQEGASGGAWLDRISLDKINYLFEDGFWFFGMSFPKWVATGQTMWNSVIHSLLCLGVPFTVTQLVMYWYGSKKLVRDAKLLFFVMVLSCFTETLFWRILFDTVAFYALVYHEDGDTARPPLVYRKNGDYHNYGGNR